LTEAGRAPRASRSSTGLDRGAQRRAGARPGAPPPPEQDIDTSCQGAIARRDSSSTVGPSRTPCEEAQVTLLADEVDLHHVGWLSWRRRAGLPHEALGQVFLRPAAARRRPPSARTSRSRERSRPDRPRPCPPCRAGGRSRVPEAVPRLQGGGRLEGLAGAQAGARPARGVRAGTDERAPPRPGAARPRPPAGAARPAPPRPAPGVGSPRMVAARRRSPATARRSPRPSLRAPRPGRSFCHPSTLSCRSAPQGGRVGRAGWRAGPVLQ